MSTGRRGTKNQSGGENSKAVWLMVLGTITFSGAGLLRIILNREWSTLLIGAGIGIALMLGWLLIEHFVGRAQSRRFYRAWKGRRRIEDVTDPQLGQYAMDGEHVVEWDGRRWRRV